MLPNSARFERLIKRFGCKIVPVATRVNGILTRRPDILGVDYHGTYVMCIPKKMYGFPNRSYRDLGGRPMMDYFRAETYFLSKIKQ